MAVLKFFAYRFLTTAACLIAGTGFAVAQTPDYLGLQRRVVELYEQHRTALVRVKAVYPAKEDGKPQLVIGTGFFISREGHLLTNASIAYRPERIWVEHGGVAYAADFIGADRYANLALLRVGKPPEHFSYLSLADADNLPPVGSLVVRLSMPLELDPTPEFGIVSGYESRFGGKHFPCLQIRTTIPGSPGDGGSLYLDLQGRVLGMQVSSIPDIRSTYILPGRAALRLRDDLLFSGAVQYAWLGLEVKPESTVADGPHLRLNQIFAGGPAAQAGLLVGDQLVQIGDYPIATLDDLRNAVFYSRPGQVLAVVVRREGQRMEFMVKSAIRPASEPLEVAREVAKPAADVPVLKTQDSAGK